MKISKRKFGVELEYTGIPRQRLRELLIANGIKCNPGGRTGRFDEWSVVYDRSVTNSGSYSGDETNCGGEAVSPVLSGKKGIKEVCKVAKIIAENGGFVDKSCGLHVHVNAFNLKVDQIKFVYERYKRFENEIDSFMPRRRRKNENGHCLSLNHAANIVKINNTIDRYDFKRVDRYFKLNLNSYYKHGTIEFRQHAGTLEPKNIENWITFCVSFVESTKSEYKKIKNSTKVAREYIELDKTNYNVKIKNMDMINWDFFDFSPDHCKPSSHILISTLYLLINKLDVKNIKLIHGHSKKLAPSSIKKSISQLRKFGLIIKHEKNTGKYWLHDVQPQHVFCNDIIQAAKRNKQFHLHRYAYNLKDDNVFSGMDKSIMIFYKEKTLELQ